jgi:nitrate/nitrite transporter NarK
VTLFLALLTTLFLTLPVTLMITLIGGRETTLFLTLLVTLTITLFIALNDGQEVPTIEGADSSTNK